MQQADPRVCPRCATPLLFKGTKRFHEGTRCGRIELFVDGVGEQFRREQP